MLRPVLTIAAIVALLYLGGCLLLFAFQRSLLFMPHPASSLPRGASAFAFDSGGVKLRVTSRELRTQAAVLYFGGNAEDVHLSFPDLENAFPDRTLFLMHYRGYGGSAGEPSEKGLVADGLALFDRVQADHSEVTVIGRSLGSGVAVQIAAARPVSRLVLVTPYYSLAEIGAKHYPIFPVRLLMRDPFDSWRYAARVTTPTLLLAAERDEIVPPASTRALLATFRPGVATLRMIEGVGHNTIQESPHYVVALAGSR